MRFHSCSRDCHFPYLVSFTHCVILFNVALFVPLCDFVMCGSTCVLYFHYVCLICK